VHVWSECIARISQLSNHFAHDYLVFRFDSDGAWLHVHHDAVLRIAMIDDHAISGERRNRVM